MVGRWGSLAGAAVVCAAGLALAQPETPLTEVEQQCGCGKAHMLRRRAELGLPVQDGQPSYAAREAMGATDVLHNLLDIEVFPETGVISGSNTMTVRSLTDGLTEFTFVLRSQFNVTSVLLNGTTPAPATTPGANSYRRTVTLDRPYNSGEEFTVKVTYSGTAVSRGFGSIEFTHQDGNSSLPRAVESLSEAYYAATWWPCKDGDVFLAGDNSDKATLDIAITAPSIYKSTANGVLHSVTPVTGGKSKWRYQSTYPMSTYLVAFATSVYSSWTVPYQYPLEGGGVGTMPVEFNLYPHHDTPGNRAACEKVVPMLNAFRPWFGEYPFVNEKYGIYQFNFGGGMEHQTNTGQTSFGESLTAHELAHQWWGDDVTCKTWADLWLNEGFATYGEAVWEERKPGSSGLPAYLAAMNARRPGAVGSSVYCYDFADMNRLFSSTYTYRKAAWVVHQLRHVVGDETFYNILEAYRAQYTGSAATTEDFKAIASAVSGKDLTQFFQQWVYGIGAPAYAMGTQAVTIDGNPYLRVSLRQTQDPSWPGAGAPAGVFAMPIDLAVESAAGSTTFVLNNLARAQHFVMPLSAPATGATLDPQTWVLNTGIVGEAYVPGPPVIVKASIAPGAAFASGEPMGDLLVTFSTPVNAPAGSITVTGPQGPVAGGYSYNGATSTGTLTLPPLAPGQYTVLVSGVSATSGGAALDGEVPGSALVGFDQPFPSGNGLAGGACSWSFTVTGQECGTSDFNGDGASGLDDDIEAFFLCLGGSCCATCWHNGADFNGDGASGLDDDIEAFFIVLGGGSC